jgi:TonB family protein
MVGFKMRFFKLALLISTLTLLVSGCVYFNTFYLAKKNFNEAENKREKIGSEEAVGGSSGQYQAAIEKSLKVITEHPDSKYVDDALYIIGKSYYHLGDFSKAERKFRELLAAYPESDYYDRSLFYLGKCRLKMEEYILARQSFIQVDSITDNEKWKAEAQYMIGEIEFNEGNFEEAVKYFTSYLEKFADAQMAPKVQYKIGEAYDSLENYEASKDAYLKVDDYDPSDSLYFEAQFNAGESYYAIGMIDSGYVIFEELSKDEKYYSSAGLIRLKLAEALEIKGDLESAIEEYSKITEEFQRSDPAARAFYRMGEIYMLEMDDLETAKVMYDSSKATNRRSEVYQQAVERSANISKLSQFRQAASAEDLEKAAQSQFQLAELFVFELENPDTAMQEFQVVIDSFPESEYAPKAHLARGFIYDKHFGMTDSSRTEYRKVLEKYPSSDEVEQAAAELDINLENTDFDYAGQRYKKAEKLMFSESNVDSAMVILQSIIDEFPNSKYAPKAAFAKAWLIEKHVVPEEWDPEDSTSVPDSTIIIAYQNVADEFAGTPFGDSALVKLGKKVTAKPRAPQQQPEDDLPPEDTALAEPGEDDGNRDAVIIGQDTILANEISTLIDTLHVVDGEPLKEGDFEYPPSAYYSRFEGYVGFMVKIDFLGKPTDWRLLQPSGIKEIDEEAVEALRYTEFDVGEIPPEYIDRWQFYRIKVELPPEIKGRQ